MSVVLAIDPTRLLPELAVRDHPAHRIASDAEALEVARTLAAEFAVGAASRDAERRLPVAEVERFSQSGLWGINVPKAHGGADVSAATLAEVTAIIAAADPSLGQIPQNHWYMVEAIRISGTEDQQRRLFARVLEGDRIGNAFAEVGTKTATDFKTRIVREADGRLRLNGRKFYSTGALFAHWIAAVAKDAEDRVVIAILPRGSQGLTLIDDWSSFGQRTTGSGSTVFENVEVDEASIVHHFRAFERPTAMGPVAQIIHAAIDHGIARAALADTIDYVRRYTRPWVDSGYNHGYEDPHIIGQVGDLEIRVSAADALLARAARFVDVARAAPDERNVAEASIAVAEAKAATTEASILVTNKLFELGGTRSTLQQNGLDRHWRNARTHTLHDPVHRKYVAAGNWWLNGVAPPRNGAI